MKTQFCRIVLAAAFFAAGINVGLSASNAPQPEEPDAWSREKCRLFREFSDATLASMGREALGGTFLKSQDAFIARGCIAPNKVCPKSATELDYANLLSLKMINAGATGSFLPFSCGFDQGP